MIRADSSSLLLLDDFHGAGVKFSDGVLAHYIGGPKCSP